MNFFEIVQHRGLNTYFLLATFFASIACFTANLFLVLCECLDLFFGLSVVPLFAISLF